jgi:hypothetical protein
MTNSTAARRLARRWWWVLERKKTMSNSTRRTLSMPSARTVAAGRGGALRSAQSGGIHPLSRPRPVQAAFPASLPPEQPYVAKAGPPSAPPPLGENSNSLPLWQRVAGLSGMTVLGLVALSFWAMPKPSPGYAKEI